MWTTTATGDHISGPWRIRGPLMGKPVYWLYHHGLRYTPTGRAADAVSFPTLTAAKRFVKQTA